MSNLEWDQMTFSQLKINKTLTHMWMYVAAVSSWKFTKFKHFHAPSTLLWYLSWLVSYPHKPNQNQQHSSWMEKGNVEEREAEKPANVHLFICTAAAAWHENEQRLRLRWNFRKFVGCVLGLIVLQFRNLWIFDWIENVDYNHRVLLLRTIKLQWTTSKFCRIAPRLSKFTENLNS